MKKKKGVRLAPEKRLPRNRAAVMLSGKDKAASRAARKREAKAIINDGFKGSLG